MSDEQALRARLIDCAFGAFFAASLIVLIIGQQWMLNLQMKDKHEAAPMFTAGLVLTGVATILGIGRFCVRVRPKNAPVHHAEAYSDAAGLYVALVPGLMVVPTRFQTPEVRIWSTWSLRCTTLAFVVNMPAEIGLSIDITGADGSFALFVAPMPFVCLGSSLALWSVVRVIVDGSGATCRPLCSVSYSSLHIISTGIALAALIASIALGLVLGPVAAKEVSEKEGLDDGDTDEWIFHVHASVRFGLLVCTLISLSVAARLGCALKARPEGAMPDAEIELRAPAPTVPTTFSVQVPPDGVAGATMRVTAPNGVMLDVTVPHGAAPGSLFQVAMPTVSTVPSVTAVAIVSDKSDAGVQHKSWD